MEWATSFKVTLVVSEDFPALPGPLQPLPRTMAQASSRLSKIRVCFFFIIASPDSKYLSEYHIPEHGKRFMSGMRCY